MSAKAGPACRTPVSQPQRNVTIRTRAVGAHRREASLDGEWWIIFDPENRGREAQWHRPEVFAAQPGKAPIRVPSCWEHIEQDYEGVAWYCCTFNAPRSLKNKAVRLRFGAVNYRAEVWLDGEVVGWHEGGYTPCEFQISDLLHFDRDNALVVRVIGPLLTRPQMIDGLQQDEMPHWRGAIAGGIWQSVQLIATAPTYVKDVFVEPRTSDEVAVVHGQIENATLQASKLAAVVRVFRYGEESEVVARQRVELDASLGTSPFTADLKIPNAALWSPEHPNLYVAQVDLEAGGEVVDSLTTRFGMREFTIRDGHFCLNGRRIYLKAVFCEGLYPNTLAYPPSDEFVRREITLAKEAGFNVLRLWRKPPPPPLLDLADEMGIMVIDAPPIECMDQNPAITPQLETRLKAEARELVLRDRNHPCVIYWEIFNEIIRDALFRIRHRVCLEARRHDPSRVIVDESGGSRAETGAHAYLPYSGEPMRILERHINLGGPIDPGDYDQFLTYGEPGTPAFVSECGAGAFPDLPRVVARYREEGNAKTPDYRSHEFFLERLEQRLEEYGWDQVFGSTSEFCLATQEVQAETNQLVLEALRLNPNVAGYCLHALTGADWIIGCGIIDIWLEKPWKAYYTAQALNQPIYLAVRVEPRNAYASQQVRVQVIAVSELARTTGRLTLTVTSPHGAEVRHAARKLTLREGIHTLLDLELAAGDASGHHVLTARLEGEGGMLCQNTATMLVLSDADLAPPTEPFAVIDPEGELTPFVTERGLACHALPAGEEPHGPVFACPSDARSVELFEQFARAFDYARRGGTVVLLRPPCDWYTNEWNNRSWIMHHRVAPTANRLLRTGLVPFAPAWRRAQGNWYGLVHAVRRHPIFDGLPVNGLMGQDYHNVYAKRTLIGVEGEAVAQTVSLDWTRYYFGLSDVWVGSDVAILPHGRGRIIVSMLRLLANLGKDPVADRIFHNMVRFAAGVSKAAPRNRRRLQRHLSEYRRRLRRLD